MKTNQFYSPYQNNPGEMVPGMNEKDASTTKFINSASTIS